MSGGIIIAGASSGSGKTSISCAIAAMFKKQNKNVQCFKTGPDYLDPIWLASASGRKCYNLDTWMTDEVYVEKLYREKSSQCSISVVEGVMGLFDGADPSGIQGSTAEIAKLLNLPVILIVSAKGVSRSLAALVKGFSEFEEGVNIQGVIANYCGSSSHAQILGESLKSAGLPPLLGWFSAGELPELPSRHLGLAKDSSFDKSIVLNELAALAEKKLDVEKILNIASPADYFKLNNTSSWVSVETNSLSNNNSPVEKRGSTVLNKKKAVRIGAAMDDAFYFYYPDNLEMLENSGAEIVPFSPVSDSRLPENLDMLFFGGGYPELFASELSINHTFLESVRTFVQSGLPVYGECGGLIYLSKGCRLLSGEFHSFSGILPFSTQMNQRRKLLGYTDCEVLSDGFSLAKKEICRGHEFHYSDIVEENPYSEGWKPLYRIKKKNHREERIEGFVNKNITASYVHLHFASNPNLAENFIKHAEKSRRKVILS